MDESSTPQPADSAPRRSHRLGDGLLQLVTITAGVLIALFFEGLVGWNRDRALVREARATIVRELAENKKELDGAIADLERVKRNLATALQLADDLLQKNSTAVRDISFDRHFPQLSAASWQTAERTGALGLMRYDEVRRYSELYGLQEVFSRHEERTLERLAGAAAITMAGDPYRAGPRALENFRDQILQMRADLLIEEQLGTTLSKRYEGELGR